MVVINHCNVWHEYSSFRLIGVVEEDKVEEAIEQIKNKLNYSDEDVQNYIDCSTVEVGYLDI
ncbi:MAG: hypothetical protein KBT06_04440 [Prevotellaceae bacterium]|nr:hypothetical protein [Candidatus Colivivens equi]